MGTEGAAALRNGAEQVTALEIDPLILKLGERLHFEKPYSSPRVRPVQNDARSYVQNTEDRFDLIVFSLLDSHTTSSHFTNIRIDNYVYTLEALQAAKRLLRPDGVFVVKFDVETPWIAGRLYGLLQKVFGQAPLQVQADSSSSTPGGRFFITGSERRIAQALSDPRLAAYVALHGTVNMSPATLTTDDWPYFYQHEPGLPASVLVISVALLVLCRPVFFAGIVFIRSFARDGFRGEALGSNLFGAMIGGILESASLWTGIRFLLVIAALLYLASWIALHLERPLDEAARNPAKAPSESLVETA